MVPSTPRDEGAMSEPDHDTESDFDFDLPPLVPQGRLVCIDEKRWDQLEREREADRAAIRACHVMFKSAPGWNVILLDHAGAVQRAIQRAQDAKG